MTEQRVRPWDEAPTVEVRVFRNGELVRTELCESEEQAALVVEEWTELDGVRCEVVGLTAHHRPGELFEPEPEPIEVGDDDYPAAW